MRLSFSVLFVTLFSLACQPSSPTLIDISPEISIADIHAAYEAGTYSAQDLTQYYLDRIESLNPKLHAVITLNPDALAIAAALDEKRASDASLGPLHGIPVLLKDNIDTHDSMPCTAGANSMAESYPLADSPLAAQLRAAGAIILGKANLSEWANFHSSTSSSGWSALGGQTRNPYDLSRNPCGSSSGSGAAVSANLCVIAIGTETNGSIVCPANNNGVVGIKPTVGLISRRGIIPISYSQDTGGPMARSVEDAVRTLGTLTAPDSLDDKTTAEGRQALTDYTPFLKQEGIAGKRIGYFKAPLGDHVRITAVMEAAVEVFRQQGAEIIEIEEPILKRTGNHSFQVLLYEFKDGLNKYFASLGPNAKVKSLEELIEKTFSDSVEMHYHDHAILKH
ncbi:MAG: amidase family protein, partial [Bacteroidota bacterium]